MIGRVLTYIAAGAALMAATSGLLSADHVIEFSVLKMINGGFATRMELHCAPRRTRPDP